MPLIVRLEETQAKSDLGRIVAAFHNPANTGHYTVIVVLARDRQVLFRVQSVDGNMDLGRRVDHIGQFLFREPIGEGRVGGKRYASYRLIPLGRSNALN